MNTIIVVLFVLGYVAIVMEHTIHINKAASALLTAVLCWTLVIVNASNSDMVLTSLSHYLAETSEIVFFLLGAMTIVELVDAHDGFQFITEKIKTNNKTKLVVLIALITFFLSAILDNLTTAIVMVSILNKLIKDKEIKWKLLGLVIIASNAGGAWSPIGDVTTTMLWIGGQITPINIIKETFLASFICMAIPTLIINYKIKGGIEIHQETNTNDQFTTNAFDRNSIFFIGLTCLLFVPIFKTVTHLPPYMGMFFSLGFMWMLTELMHQKKGTIEKGNLSVNHALRKIDTPSILFFFGILISIASLGHIGFLPQMAQKMEEIVGNENIIAIGIGFLSSIFDNVPLVAALQNMYALDKYPMDHYFWELLAYSAGTGGSSLIIGSAAGVVIMGMEKINFFWYLKNISWIAVIGFLSGAFIYILQNEFMTH